MAVLPTGIGPVTGYNIERSLRFNSADSAYLNRTVGSAATSNTLTTFSFWFKRSKLSTSQIIFSTNESSNVACYIELTTSDTLRIYLDMTSGGSDETSWVTTAVFRDVSAWYHAVIKIDVSQASNANKVLLYINNVSQTLTATQTGTAVSTQRILANGASLAIGKYTTAAYYGDFYLTEFYAIDGQALDPSSFGLNDPETGVWKPKAYTGTYGTNGFYLKFADNSNTTAATLGKDSSGNGNNWTPNNFSVSAGAGNDSLVDTPTSYGTDTGVGGEVRGNYCTWNPLDNSISTLNNGNLSQSSNYANSQWCRGTIELVTGKWYWEGTLTASNGDGSGTLIGICNSVPLTTAGNHTAISNNAIQYLGGSGDKRVYGTTTTYGSSYTTNDVIGVAVDKAAGTIQFFKNNVSQGVITDSRITSDLIFPLTGNNSTSGSKDWSFNFGQRPFAYTAPSGFKALCTQNLPTPTIGATSTTQAGKYFNTVLYTGDYTTSKSITGVGFQPDFVWIKDRGLATVYNYSHALFDAVRGAGKWISTNRTDAELDYGTGTTSAFRSFNSDGFTVGQNYNTNEVDPTAESFVAWNWKANGAGSSNTAGTITSTVSASTTSGFSIVTYTGTGSNATVGHGLGVAPSMVITKGRDSVVGATNWKVYHTSLGNTKNLNLNLTNAEATSSTVWNNTSPTSTVFSIGTNGDLNGSGATYVAYCFAAVAGYSAFGSYTGNGSNDGVFVYTGFRPRWILVKRTDSTAGWHLYDTARDTYNAATKRLQPDLSNAENTANGIIDILSNGWKFRNTNTDWDASGGTYIYAAFAESPFKYALAR